VTAEASKWINVGLETGATYTRDGIQLTLPPGDLARLKQRINGLVPGAEYYAVVYIDGAPLGSSRRTCASCQSEDLRFEFDPPLHHRERQIGISYFRVAGDAHIRLVIEEINN